MNTKCFLLLCLLIIMATICNTVFSLSIEAPAQRFSKFRLMAADEDEDDQVHSPERTNGAKGNKTDHSAVVVKTHVIWQPPVESEDSEEELEPSKLVILPLGAFLALIIGTCIKISHWWNEDIREADGMLENIYSTKNPNPGRRVLARVLSIERGHGDHPNPEAGTSKHSTFYKKYRRKSKVMPETSMHVPETVHEGINESDSEEQSTESVSSDTPVMPRAAPGDIFQTSEPTCSCEFYRAHGQMRQGRYPMPTTGRRESFVSMGRQESFVSMGSRTELIPLLPMYSMEQLKYDMNSPVIETTNVSFPPQNPTPKVGTTLPKKAVDQVHSGKLKAKHKKASVRDKKHAKRKQHGLNSCRPRGVSKLVLDSLSFNLHLMQLALEENMAKRNQGSPTDIRGSSSSSASHSSTPVHPGDVQLEHGFIEDSFIHPGECSSNDIPKQGASDCTEGSESISPTTENTALSSSAQSSVSSAPWSPIRSRPLSRKGSTNAFQTAADFMSKAKPSLSSFSSFATSSSSLSRSTASHLGDSRMFYHLAPASPVSSPDGTSCGSETISEAETGSMKKSQTSTDIARQGEDVLRQDIGGAKCLRKQRYSSLRMKDGCGDRPVFFIV